MKTGVFILRLYHEHNDTVMCRAINKALEEWEAEEPYIKILSTQVLSSEYSYVMQEAITRLYITYRDTREEENGNTKE